MEYLCTTCCERKRRGPGLLPASQRYLARRIQDVLEKAADTGRPARLLSGRFGVLDPGEQIPWYDQALDNREVESLAHKVAGQLVDRAVTSLVFYARPPATPGWSPYFAVLEAACREAGVWLRVVEWPEKSCEGAI